MKHVLFGENTTYKTAILIKASSLTRTALLTNYVYPLFQQGLEAKDFIGFSLLYNSSGKAPTTLIREYLGTLLRALDAIGTTTMYVADAAYFKVLTKSSKAEPHLGYVLPCKMAGYEHMSVILGVNHSSLFYNPANEEKLKLSLSTLKQHLMGEVITMGSNVIHHEAYPDTLEEIAAWLDKLHQYPELAVDIEAFSLKHYDAGIGTIEFAWNQHEGIAFCCDYEPTEAHEIQVWDKKDEVFKTRIAHGRKTDNPKVRALLKKFFTTYKGKLIYHNAAYDVKVILYTLWMENIIDHHGLLEGLEIMTRDIDCTKIISYLATNNCSENSLSLKALAHEYVGNYAEDVNDIRLVPVDRLLRYNLIDGLATHYVRSKYYPIMVQDEQEKLYLELFKDSIANIVNMELTGMPMNWDEIQKGKLELQSIHDTHAAVIKDHPRVADALKIMQDNWVIKDLEDRREKSKNPDNIQERDLDDLYNGNAPKAFPKTFNPNSGNQLAILLYNVCKLPIIDTTPTGLPATDDDTLEALINHTKDKSIKDLIEHVRMLLGVDKILSTFIPAFEQAQLGPDGIYYLFGSFNLGGTKSGRLSSSNPNLQNLPSGSTYAKVIKRMFRGNAEWLFVGSDYNALEDVVNTLLTKDPNKERVLIEGYDGHMFRAVHYWPQKWPDLELTPTYVNALKKPFDAERTDSKPVSFALQYQGTWLTLVKNCGFTEEEAKAIEANFHQLYAVSAQYTRDRLTEASKLGYTTLAYGLRLRTPMLKKTILNARNTPREAAAEARTAGNALSGQSYGLINTKASNEFMKRVRASEYRYDIRLCAHIHDAQYYLIRNNLGVIKWVNDNLIDCMVNRIEGELPELSHPLIKLGAELDLFPSWDKKITIPNGADIHRIYEIASTEYGKLMAA